MSCPKCGKVLDSIDEKSYFLFGFKDYCYNCGNKARWESKSHLPNICLNCPRATDFSPKNRTCYCMELERRTKCVTECDDFNWIVRGIETRCGERIIEKEESKEQ